MQVDTHISDLALSTDTNHSRYITQYITSTSSLVGKEINTIEIWMFKSGNPTGYIIIGVFDSNGNLIKQFGVISATTITNHIIKYTFSVNEPYEIQANDYIGVYYNNGDASNYVMLRIASSNPFDDINSYRCRYATSWVCATNEDLQFL
jgi:hypothetical protein